MRIEVLEDTKIHKRFAETNYRLVAVEKEFRRPEQPNYFRIQVSQICPNGHENKKRWNGKITCKECSQVGVRVNKQGLYLMKEDQVSFDIKNTLRGVHKEFRKRGLISYSYFPKQTKLHVRILLALLRMFEEKVDHKKGESIR